MSNFSNKKTCKKLDLNFQICHNSILLFCIGVLAEIVVMRIGKISDKFFDSYVMLVCAKAFLTNLWGLLKEKSKQRAYFKNNPFINK